MADPEDILPRSDFLPRAIGAAVMIVILVPFLGFCVHLLWPGETGIGWGLAVGVVIVAGVAGVPLGWWFGPQETPMRFTASAGGAGAVLVSGLLAFGGPLPLLLGIVGGLSLGYMVGTMIGIEIIDRHARRAQQDSGPS